MVLAVYIIDNLPKASFNKGVFFIYLIKPVLWLGIFTICILLPKVRYGGKNKHKKFLRGWVIYLAVFYIALKVLGGLIHGFGKSPYKLTFLGILQNLFLFLSVLIGKEYSRSYLVNNANKKHFNISLVITTVIFTLISLPISGMMALKDNFDVIRFVGEQVLPQLSLNILASYLVYLGGPMLSILYIGITQGIQYISPILGDLKWITNAIIGILAPIFSFMFIQYAYLKESRQMKRKNSEKDKPLGWITTAFASVMIVWFFVGVFPIYPSVIITGSMKPVIDPGDMVIVKKLKGSEVKEGDIIQYKKDDIYIFHRIIKVVEDKNQVKYQAKGDNNSVEDRELVSAEMIKGRVIKVIPKVGWPTILIRDKRNDVPKEQVEF